MFRVRREIWAAAQLDRAVLILGEEGAGKELAAAGIHALSPRSAHPRICINVAAIPEGMIESELFGHVKGAFTGADRAKAGMIVQAHRGTLFLDEIADADPRLQAKLLRFLQEREVAPLGGGERVSCDVRIVSATHADVDGRRSDGRLRRDFLDRVGGLRVRVPPLRERLEDVPLLAAALARRCLGGFSIARGGMQRLARYDWPGNVRRLESAIERLAAAMLAAGEWTGTPPIASSLRVDALLDELRHEDRIQAPTPAKPAATNAREGDWEFLQRVSRDSRSLYECAAERGWSEETLRRKLKAQALLPRPGSHRLLARRTCGQHEANLRGT